MHNSHVWLVAITEIGKHGLVKERVTSMQLHPMLRATVVKNVEACCRWREQASEEGTREGWEE